jgi:hypothetical protein
VASFDGRCCLRRSRHARFRQHCRHDSIAGQERIGRPLVLAAFDDAHPGVGGLPQGKSGGLSGQAQQAGRRRRRTERAEHVIRSAGPLLCEGPHRPSQLADDVIAHHDRGQQLSARRSGGFTDHPGHRLRHDARVRASGEGVVECGAGASNQRAVGEHPLEQVDLAPVADDRADAIGAWAAELVGHAKRRRDLKPRLARFAGPGPQCQSEVVDDEILGLVDDRRWEIFEAKTDNMVGQSLADGACACALDVVIIRRATRRRASTATCGGYLASQDRGPTPGALSQATRCWK